jgi:hypothetical protein
MDNDPTLFEECCKKFEEDEAEEDSMRSKREVGMFVALCLELFRFLVG